MVKISKIALFSLIVICFYSNQSFAMRRNIFSSKNSTFLKPQFNPVSMNKFCTKTEPTQQILCANCSKLNNSHRSWAKNISLGILGVGLGIPVFIFGEKCLINYSSYWTKKANNFFDTMKYKYLDYQIKKSEEKEQKKSL